VSESEPLIPVAEMERMMKGQEVLNGCWAARAGKRLS
jgi:hypothetical protein